MVDYGLKNVQILMKRDGSCFLVGGITLKKPGRKSTRFKFDKKKGLRIIGKVTPEIRSIVPDLREKLEALTN